MAESAVGVHRCQAYPVIEPSLDSCCALADTHQAIWPTNPIESQLPSADKRPWVHRTGHCFRLGEGSIAVFLGGATTNDAVCPFCHPHDDAEQKVVFENATCCFLQHARAQDVLEGCGVIVPKAHRQDAFSLTAQEWTDTFDLLHKAKQYLEERFHPAGYTLGWNVGAVSNQTIPHAHFHVVPRYDDEPYAGRGLRYWLKQPENARPGRQG